MLKLLMITLAAVSIGAASAATASAGGGCCRTHNNTSAPRSTAQAQSGTRQAQSGARTYRRYSYEPSTRSYSAPRMRRSRSPGYSLPKSDPRKYSVD